MAKEAVLVHDIKAPHPRLKYFDDMVDKVAKESGGLTIAINPGGKIIYPGKKSLDAVITKKVPLTLVNTALLSSMDPRLGFVGLPFKISDELMENPHNAEVLINLIQAYLEPPGLKILGIMRGADTIFIMKEKHISTVEDLRGMRIRVAAPGLYEEILKSLGADPIPLPSKEIDDAFKRGELDGMSTSPGGWVLSGPIGNKGSLVPGLIFYTYSMIADKEWFESLPSKQQRVLEDAAKACITDRWHDMKMDDTKVIKDLVDRNNGVVTYTMIPQSGLSPWKRKVEPVIEKFEKTFPDAVENYNLLIK